MSASTASTRLQTRCRHQLGARARCLFDFEHQSDTLRVELVLVRARVEHRAVERLQARWERAIWNRRRFGKTRDAPDILGDTGLEFLVVRVADLRARQHDNTCFGSVDARLPRPFRAGLDAVLELVRILAEV